MNQSLSVSQLASSPLPVENSPLMDHLSASRLSLWIKCPRAFQYRYVDGIPSPPNANLFLGKFIHGALEFYYRHRQLGIWLSWERLASHFSTLWNSCRAEEGFVFQSAEEESTLKAHATSLLYAYFECFSGRGSQGQQEGESGSVTSGAESNHPPAPAPFTAIPPAQDPLSVLPLIQTSDSQATVPVTTSPLSKPLAVETSLETELVDPATGDNLGMQLMGILDLVENSPKGPVIIDFKTAARATPPSPLAHEVQLTAYSYLFRQATGLQESHLEIRQLIKTKTPKIAIHCFPPRTEVHFRRFFALVREYLEALARRQWNSRPSWNCGMCEYQERCCGEVGQREGV